MINTIYRLSAPKFFEEVFVEETDFNKVIIRPKYLSICQADQRYFNGNRPPEVLNKKLPMALFHEAVGEVIYSPDESFEVGDNVVMIPNTPTETDDIILENYLRSSRFRSSGYDGFMSEYVFMNNNRLVKLPKDINLEVTAFTELISVGVHAISRFKMFSHKRKEKIGVWGDGSFGYIISLLLKYIFPESEIYIFGVNYDRLSYFSFVDKRFKVNEVPDNLNIDHAFECVGSTKAQDAINQIIDIINPQGSISLLGVSEYNVPINTRMVLEKGLNIFGSSRSGYNDFKEAVNLFTEHPQLINYFENLITNKVTINEISDVNKAFELDLQSKFGKTVLKWDI